MKKKIVYLLCELGLIKIAEKISPSIVCVWRGEKVAQGIKKAFETVINTTSSFAIGIQKGIEEIEKYKENTK